MKKTLSVSEQIEVLKKEISPMTFRYSFATLHDKNNTNLRAIAEYLGHETSGTTERYYVQSKRKSLEYNDINSY